ncbi:hypothetical protein [Helicobacter sp. T3_23-1056]
MLDSANHSKNAESNIDCHDFATQNLATTENSAKSHTARDSQSNNRSNGGVALRCFDAERAKIGQNDHSREVSYQNNANEYPRTNCPTQNAESSESFLTIHLL